MPLRALWGCLERLFVHLGRSGECLGGLIGRLGGVLGTSCGDLGVSWALLGKLWAPLEGLEALPWMLLGLLGLALASGCISKRI